MEDNLVKQSRKFVYVASHDQETSMVATELIACGSSLITAEPWYIKNTQSTKIVIDKMNQ